MGLMIKDGSIRIRDGHKLEAAWHGPGPDEAPTLVFLHEGLGCMELWRDFPADLAAATGCGAMVYSRLGYGHSDPARYPFEVNFMHAEGLDILPEIVAETGIQKMILIGHSDGGSIAILYAGGTPALPLAGVITEAAHVFCEDVTVKSIENALRMYQEGGLRQRLMRYHGSNTDCAFYGWNGAWLNPEFMHWNIESFLPKIQVPILAIQGSNDIYGTTAQIESIQRLANKNAQVKLIDNCGHAPHKEQPEITFDLMKTFILQVFGNQS